MLDLWQRLQQTDKPIVLYGMGDGADKILQHLKEYDIRIRGVFSSDGFQKEKTYAGFRVMSYGQMQAIYPRMVILVAFGSSRPEVMHNIRQLQGEQELYAPDVPVVGGGLFNAAYYEEHKEQLDWVRERLADDQSRLVFDYILAYKLSGKINYLFDCETDLADDQMELLELHDRESFLDLGAYKGDTVEGFLALTGGKYTHITAVEPDRKNYNKLCRLEGDNREYIHAGIGETSGQMLFSVRGGRNSRKAEVGGESIPMVCIDDLNHEFTYIKMDVEGQERAAILGGKEKIAATRPKMQIAAYHRNEDLFDLPLLLKDIPYKVYLRHNPSVPAWDTNFFFC